MKKSRLKYVCILLIGGFCIFLVAKYFFDPDEQVEINITKNITAMEQKILPPTVVKKDVADRDENGCNVSKNYLWDNDLGCCLEASDVGEESYRLAIKASVEYLRGVKGINIEKVIRRDCEGCFFVNLDLYGEKIQIDVFENKGRSSRPIYFK